MNQLILSGNLGADPETFFTGNGDPISTFNLAFKSSRKKDDTNWIKVTAFNKLAEICQVYLHTGARICVSGYLNQDKWETEDGGNGQVSSSSQIASNLSRQMGVDLKKDRATKTYHFKGGPWPNTMWI